MIDFFGILKGLKIQKETDRSKQLILQVGSSATANTATTIEANQTANRTISLPDANGQLMTPSSTDTLTNKTIDGDNNTLQDIPLSAIKTDGGEANTFVVRDGTGALDSVTYTQATALLNPMVGDSGSGGLKGLVPAPVTGDAAKFLRGDGTFQSIPAGSGDVTGPASSTDNAITRFDGVSGKLIQNSTVTISDAGVVAGASLNNTNLITVLDSNLTIQDNVDNTKQVQFQASSVGTGTMATLTVPSATTTLVGTTSTQALTNKDIDGGAASNSNRITLPQNTTGALAALTRKEATIAYDTTLNQVVYDDGSSFQPIANNTPTGDANTIAYFDGAGNLSSDDQDLRYTPDAIFYGQQLDSTTSLFSENALVLAHAEGAAPINNPSLNASQNSILIAFIENQGKSFSSDRSIAHGSSNGLSSYFNAANESHAHGQVLGLQSIIEATGQSHAHGNVNTANDGRILASNCSSAFGEVTDDFFIEAANASFAGGQTNGDGGVHASNVSMSFGEDINEGATTPGRYNYQFGQGHISNAPHVTKFGRYSNSVAGDGVTWVSTDPLFILGNGLNIGSRSDALRVDKDGRVQTTGAEIVPVREITTSGSVSARTDRMMLLNGSGAQTLALPPGENGLKFTFAPPSANTATWALTPDGGDTLDGNVPGDLGTEVTTTVIFLNTVWYRI